MDKQGIRSIHDAIDVICGRVASVIAMKKAAEISKAEKDANDELGISAAYDLIERQTGERPYMRSAESSSPLGKMIADRTQPIVAKYNELGVKVARAQEDAHISVVVGNYDGLVDGLRKSMESISKLL